MEFLKLARLQWDRTAAVGLTVLGFVVLLIGWVGTSGTEYIAEQIPYLVSGGLFGIAFLTAGAVLWLSADMRDEWRALVDQAEVIREEQVDRRARIAELVEAEVAKAVRNAAAGQTRARRTPARAAEPANKV